MVDELDDERMEDDACREMSMTNRQMMNRRRR